MSKFDIPMINVPNNNISEINDILNIGRQADVFKLKKEVIVKKVPVNVSDSNNNNLFHLILKDELGKTETAIINFFKYLIENNVNPEQPDNYNRTPLHYASMNHYNKIIKYLLEIGCNPNFKDNFGMTPMHYFLGGKIKLYKDKTPKNIITFSDKVDLNKKKEIRDIKLEILKFINDRYNDKSNEDLNYLDVFDKLFEDIMLSDDVVKKIRTKIMNKSTDLVQSDENKEKEMNSMIKEIRADIESNILDIFDPDKFTLDTDIKINENEIMYDSLYPNAEINENYILDNITVSHYKINILHNALDELNEMKNEIKFNQDKFDELMELINDYMRLNKDNNMGEDFKNKINDLIDVIENENLNDLDEELNRIKSLITNSDETGYLNLLNENLINISNTDISDGSVDKIINDINIDFNINVNQEIYEIIINFIGKDLDEIDKIYRVYNKTIANEVLKEKMENIVNQMNLDLNNQFNINSLENFIIQSQININPNFLRNSKNIYQKIEKNKDSLSNNINLANLNKLLNNIINFSFNFGNIIYTFTSNATFVKIDELNKLSQFNEYDYYKNYKKNTMPIFYDDDKKILQNIGPPQFPILEQIQTDINLMVKNIIEIFDLFIKIDKINDENNQVVNEILNDNNFNDVNNDKFILKMKKHNDLLKTFILKLVNLTNKINKKIIIDDEDKMYALEFINNSIELFNKISFVRVLEDFYGLKIDDEFNIIRDGDYKKIDINYIYDFFVPIIEYDEDNYMINDKMFKFDKSYIYNINNANNIRGVFNDDFKSLKFNEKTRLIKLSPRENESLPYLFIEAVKRTQTNMMNLIFEFFIKKIIFEDYTDLNRRIKIPQIIKEKIKIFYNKNISFNDQNINNLNKKKIMIDLIKDVVIDYTKIRLNNKINKMLQNLISNTRLKFSRIEEIKSVLDIIDNDDIEFNLDFKIKKNDNFNKKANIEKNFFVFSDDYSSLDLETEKLVVKINENTMLDFIINGGSLMEKDGNGKLPLDLIIENKYYSILEKLKLEGVELFNIKRYSESLNYAINIMKDNLRKIKTEEFYDNQYRDLIELIESNLDFKYNIYKDNKLAFKACNYFTKVFLKNNTISFNFDKKKILNTNYLINQLKYKDLMENDFKTLESLILVNDSINQLEKSKDLAEEYFSNNKYIENNESKKAIYNILKLVGEKIIVEQIELFIKKIIYESYQNNYNPTDNNYGNIENIFKAGSLMKKSLHESLNELNELFIKNSCKIFENHREEHSFNYRTVNDYLNDFIDKIPMNIYVSFKPDDKMINLLKDNVTNYSDNFIYNMYKNLLIVCENNLKFIINHYRNLNVIKNLT